LDSIYTNKNKMCILFISRKQHHSYKIVFFENIIFNITNKKKKYNFFL